MGAFDAWKARVAEGQDPDEAAREVGGTGRPGSRMNALAVKHAAALTEAWSLKDDERMALENAIFFALCEYRRQEQADDLRPALAESIRRARGAK